MLNLLDRFDRGTRARGICEYEMTRDDIEHVEACSGCEERWWDGHAMTSIRGGFELNDLDEPTMALSPVPAVILDGWDEPSRRDEISVDDLRWI